ncbi:MAG: type IV pilus assembly protein PilM [Candidatus Omnitrophica bacterium]|nr:type IV pilus assembly protein PilM [Candidatus Omnitrophota bacterium]MDD5437292.1 type IV pilus assembly protein PilM [Candidatus Omnitrophota bacterium]
MTSGGGNRVAIDIGTSSIKILQASGTADKPVVTAAGYKDIIGLSGDAVSEALKSLAEEIQVSAKDALISISGPSVIVRFISLPRMDDAALKGAIRYEAEKFIPYNISECIIDFQTLRKDDKDNKLNVLLVAAKKDYVDARIGLIENAGFSVKLIDVDSFALANAFLRNAPSSDPNKSYAVLNIGGAHTNVSILKGELIYFSRDIIMGGNDFTSAISRKLGIGQKEAEAAKIAPPKDKEPEVLECVKTVFNDLLDEIKLSFGYYENQAGKGIDEVYISGGTANIIGLEGIFEESLESKPVLWDPMGFADISSAGVEASFFEKMKNRLCIAAGLLLR